MKNPLERCIDFKKMDADPSLKKIPLNEATERRAQMRQTLMQKLLTKIQDEGLAVSNIKTYPKNGVMWLTPENEKVAKRVDQLVQEVLGDGRDIFEHLPAANKQRREEDEEDPSQLVKAETGGGD